MLSSIEAEIIDYIRQESENRDFSLIGPMAISWIKDKRVKKKYFRIKVSFSRASELPVDIRSKSEGAKRHAEMIKHDKQKVDLPQEAVIRNLTHILTVTEGFEKGKVFKLSEKEYQIGRNEQCEVSIGDPKISRSHARIFWEQDNFILEDLNSKTGTFVNFKRINKIDLKPDDIIEIGHTTMKYLKLFV
jgi:hypothetical protein